MLRRDVRLETAQPLEGSVLWRWTREFYGREGARAWTTGTVPWRITSTPLLADAFADVAAAYAADLRRAGTLAPGAPLCLLDVGAGTGRLAFLLARALDARGVPFRLVMTDVVGANVEAWKVHPQLAPLAARGLLDFAVADAAKGGPLALELSLETWQPGALPGPLVVLATYLLDTLPHALWRKRDGRLEEGLVTVDAPDGSHALADARWAFTFAAPAVAPAPFLRAYAATLADGPFLVPVGAFDFLQAMARLGGGRALSLLADKGPRTPRQLAAVPFPGLARHGCVSGSVNFHALKAWAGFRAWLGPREQAMDFGTVCLAQGVGRRALRETCEAFDAALGDNQPLAAQARVDALAEEEDAAPPTALLQALAATHYSPDAFVRFAPALRATAGALPGALVPVLVESLDAVWLNHFELGEDADVAFELATVLHRAGQLSHAARYYEASVARRGAHPATCFNLALCRLDLGDSGGGRAELERVLALSPAHERARALLQLVPG